MSPGRFHRVDVIKGSDPAVPPRVAALVAAENQARKDSFSSRLRAKVAQETRIAAEKWTEEEKVRLVAEDELQAKKQRAQEEKLCFALDDIGHTLSSAIVAMERIAVEKRAEVDSLTAEAAASDAEVTRLSVERQKLHQEATTKVMDPLCSRMPQFAPQESRTLAKGALVSGGSCSAIERKAQRESLAAWAAAHAAEDARITAERKAEEENLAAEAAARVAEEARAAVAKKVEEERLVSEAARVADDMYAAYKTIAKRESLAAWATAKAAEEARLAVAKKAEYRKWAAEAATKLAAEARLAAEKKATEGQIAADTARNMNADVRSDAEGRANRDSLAAWAASTLAFEEQKTMVAEDVLAQQTYVTLDAITEELVAEKSDELVAREAAFASVKPCQEDDDTTASPPSESTADQAEGQRAKEESMDFLISYLSAEKTKIEEQRRAAQAAAKIAHEERLAAERKAAVNKWTTESRQISPSISEQSNITVEVTSSEHTSADAEAQMWGSALFADNGSTIKEKEESTLWSSWWSYLGFSRRRGSEVESSAQSPR